MRRQPLLNYVFDALAEPRALGPVRRFVVSAATIAVATGVMLAFSYMLARLPGISTAATVDEQSVPDWLWRLAAGLVVVGSAVAAVAILSARRSQDGQSALAPGRIWVCAFVVIGFWGTALLVGLAAKQSTLRWVPAGIAGIATVFAPIAMWWGRDTWR